jgi:hypothetical protein
MLSIRRFGKVRLIYFLVNRIANVHPTAKPSPHGVTSHYTLYSSSYIARGACDGIIAIEDSCDGVIDQIVSAPATSHTSSTAP